MGAPSIFAKKGKIRVFFMLLVALLVERYFSIFSGTFCLRAKKWKTPENVDSQGFERRSRDLNPGCGHPHYSLSRGFTNPYFSRLCGFYAISRLLVHQSLFTASRTLSSSGCAYRSSIFVEDQRMIFLTVCGATLLSMAKAVAVV